MKTERKYLIERAAVALIAAVLIWMAYGTPVRAADSQQSPGPTLANCWSAEFHAASDCDRLASARTFTSIPTPPGGPTLANCWSAEFHAASDCDRLASTMLMLTVGSQE
jgi:hypothetical protein